MLICDKREGIGWDVIPDERMRNVFMSMVFIIHFVESESLCRLIVPNQDPEVP